MPSWAKATVLGEGYVRSGCYSIGEGYCLGRGKPPGESFPILGEGGGPPPGLDGARAGHLWLRSDAGVLPCTFTFGNPPWRHPHGLSFRPPRGPAMAAYRISVTPWEAAPRRTQVSLPPSVYRGTWVVTVLGGRLPSVERVIPWVRATALGEGRRIGRV